ncbi:MAG: Gldg family protein [Gammaproteobacteria bacterium]|nr:Gldg family protein [Gammaproteobacteria bacterium]
MASFSQTAKHEFRALFSSLSAYLFIALFLIVSLFIFFWVETFFARNLADVRPLFEWMPLLMIFLVAALTMRMWSDERRSGNLEMLLTSSTPVWRLVVGKFTAVSALVLLALLLTLPLPLTVALSGPLDWGPVIGGYIASLLLAASYASIGLYLSSRTDNQIVSLIGTIAICGMLYVIGSGTLTAFAGQRLSEIMAYFGSGSHFLSITRGVIDFRDLFYYVSLTLIFLLLNFLSVEKLRLAGGLPGRQYRRRQMTVFVVINLLLMSNVLLTKSTSLRIDLTQGKRFSISETTHEYLQLLQQPLLLRGYFSARTHPLLTPLVPQLRDLMREYEVAGGGMLKVEIIDPLEEPELEQEAGQMYGIEPVAFQVADKYQSSLVNSYFNLLIRYGDQFRTLDYNDLIDVKMRSETDLDIRLRNPEYDITRAIRRVLSEQRSGKGLFDSIGKPVTFRGFISTTQRLPVGLQKLKQDLDALLEVFEQGSGGRFTVSIIDPQVDDGAVAKEIRSQYGFRPMVLGLLKPDPFFFYMVLESGGQWVPIPVPEDLKKEHLQASLEAGLRHFAPGVLRTITLTMPAAPDTIFGFKRKGQASYFQIEKHLRESVIIRKDDLSSGSVPAGSDLLLLIAPESLNEKQLFAIDQYLMQGGAVIIAAAPWKIKLGSDAITTAKHETGLELWLAHHGITLREAIVMDAQNSVFPIPVQRNSGNAVVDETQNLAYPFFPDIRRQGMENETGITASLNQVTLNWAAPITIDARDHDVIPLLRSSTESWLEEQGSIQPDFERFPQSGFQSGNDQEKHAYLLAAIIQGRFDSFFKGKKSPLFDVQEGEQQLAVDVIERSSADGRIILISSDIFLADSVIDLATRATGSRYLNSMQLIENIMEWSFEEPGLLKLRGRGDYARTLLPLSREQQRLREYLNYAAAITGVMLLYAIERLLRRRRRRAWGELTTDAHR